MSDIALTHDNRMVLASDYTDEQWQNLKESYAVGDFLMPCCKSPAIPKTSPNFLHFFAHHSDECATSPESIWHLQTKEDVCIALKSKGLDAHLEYLGKGQKGKWIADVYFELNDRRIAIEIQHSYQQINDYLKRQQKYEKSGVETYWLLYPKRYKTLTKSLAKHRLTHDFSGRYPDSGFLPCIPELPIVFYDTDAEQSVVKGAGLFQAPLGGWLQAIIDKTFVYHDGRWLIQS